MIRNASRVAFLIESLRGGGAERVVTNLATEFSRNDWEVDIILIREAGELVSELPDCVNVHVLRSSRTLRSVPQLVKYTRNYQPDVMIANMTHINVVSTIATSISRVDTTLLVVEHSMVSDRINRMGGWKELVTAKIAGMIYSQADGIITVSDGVAMDLSTVTGIERSSITVIHNPIITEEFSIRAGEAIDHKWFGEDSLPVIVSVGRLEERKDLPTLLRAFHRLINRRECRLVICGDGPDREYLRTLVQELEIEEKVYLPGWVDNPYRYMNNSDVFVLSSETEGLPTVIVEALATGCPVVSTDCESGPAEILAEGEYGWLVPVGDYEALANCIEKAIDNEIDADKLKSRASDFRSDVILSEYLSVVNNADG